MFVVMDIETTGLDRYTNEVIQFAALRMTNSLMPIEAKCFYLWHPGIVWGAEDIHHISEEMAKKEEHMFEANIRTIMRMVSYTPSVTHNGIAFDIPFLKSYLRRIGVEPGLFNPEKANPEDMWGPAYDTMKIYQPVFRKRMKLTNLVQELGITEEVISMCCKQSFGKTADFHDASYDTTATALAFTHAVQHGLV